MREKFNYRENGGLSGWGHVGRTILWAIPVLGWLIWFTRLWAKNAGVRGYARSYICWVILGLIVTAIVGVICVALYVVAPDMVQPLIDVIKSLKA